MNKNSKFLLSNRRTLYVITYMNLNINTEKKLLEEQDCEDTFFKIIDHGQMVKGKVTWDI